MILYKKDTKGKIRYLDITSFGDQIIQKSGVLGTTKEIKHSKIAKPKNIGKSNETTSEQQAQIEVESIILSKLQEGYFQSIKEAENEVIILPMLAKSYDDEKHKIDWDNCWIQPKLDGMRCLAHITKDGKVTLVSRDGRTIENMHHIEVELSNIKLDIILDGELYLHGLSFQENMKLIKKYRTGETEKIRYNVYDVVSDNNFNIRHEIIRSIRFDRINHCDLVTTHKIINEHQLKEIHISHIGSGFEGTMVRWGLKPYKLNGRSENLLKYKDFKDLDAVIIDIEPGEQRPEWGIPVLKFGDKIFKAGLRFSHEDRKEFLSNKNNYIGKTATIRYFELTDDGIPRFPIMVGIRLDCQK